MCAIWFIYTRQKSFRLFCDKGIVTEWTIETAAKRINMRQFKRMPLIPLLVTIRGSRVFPQGCPEQELMGTISNQNDWVWYDFEQQVLQIFLGPFDTVYGFGLWNGTFCEIETSFGFLINCHFIAGLFDRKVWIHRSCPRWPLMTHWLGETHTHSDGGRTSCSWLVTRHTFLPSSSSVQTSGGKD